MKRKPGVRSYKQLKALNPVELATLRAQKGTQAEFSALIRLSVQRISQAETGKAVPTSCAETIARALDRSVESLFASVYKMPAGQALAVQSASIASSPGPDQTISPPALAGRSDVGDIPDNFRDVFGTDTKIYLVYSELTLNPLVPEIIDAYGRLLRYVPRRTVRIGDPRTRGELKDRPLVTYDPSGKHGSDGYHFRAQHSACVCEVRAAAYLSAAFSEFKSLKFSVVGNAHYEVHKKADLSFVSFGTLINSKTQALLQDSQSLVDFRNGRFVSNRLQMIGQPGDRPRFLHEPVSDSSKYDYGVIIRIHPADSTVDNQRVWIACAGVQQIGTSGAALVLAKGWRDIAGELEHHTGRFVCLVRVPKDADKSDEFAKLQWIVERPQDLEQHEM